MSNPYKIYMTPEAQMNKLKLNKESIKNLSTNESANIQGGLYATMMKCETDDYACKSIAMCPVSLFSCDTITVQNC